MTKGFSILEMILLIVLLAIVAILGVILNIFPSW